MLSASMPRPLLPLAPSSGVWWEGCCPSAPGPVYEPGVWVGDQCVWVRGAVLESGAVDLYALWGETEGEV